MICGCGSATTGYQCKLCARHNAVAAAAACVHAVATLVLVVSRSCESGASSKGGEEGGEGLHCVVELDETSVLVSNE